MLGSLEDLQEMSPGSYMPAGLESFKYSNAVLSCLLNKIWYFAS